MSARANRKFPREGRPWWVILLNLVVLVIVVVVVGVLVRHGYDPGTAIGLVATIAAVAAEITRRMVSSAKRTA